MNLADHLNVSRHRTNCILGYPAALGALLLFALPLAAQPFPNEAQGFSVEVPTTRGHVYALEYRASLTDAQWTALPLVAGTGAAVTLADPSPPAGQRFYRVCRW